MQQSKPAPIKCYDDDHCSMECAYLSCGPRCWLFRFGLERDDQGYIRCDKCKEAESNETQVID